MRVGIISPYSLTVPGGVQSQILSLARAYRSHGVQAQVLGPCDGAPPEVGVTPLGVSIPTAANGSIAPLAPDVPAQLRTIRALRDEAFDVLHLHEPLAPGPTMTATLMKPCPLVGTFHAAGSSPAYRWLGPATRYLAERLDVRCAVSADAEAMARTSLGGSYVRVFNGVELARFATGDVTASSRPVVFFIGRHEERKGLGVLLEAAQQLPDDVAVWVGGEGPETQGLQKRWAADTRIEWLGRLTEPEKIERLRSADVFCAPSLRGESFGIVLLEAMAAGTAIVASDLPGYARVARHGEHAELVAPGDADALARALAKLLSDRSASQALVAAGVERATEFSMSRLAERYLDVFAAVAGNSTQRS